MSPIYKKIIFSLLISLILAFSVFFLQNSAIGGSGLLAKLLLEKIKDRCAFSYFFTKYNYMRLAIHYLKHYGAPLFLIIFLIALIMKEKSTRYLVYYPQEKNWPYILPYSR